MVLESALGWYQGRISLYDKQSWETTVEQRILQGLSYTPRKTANPKTEFIDVDLVRGVYVPPFIPQFSAYVNFRSFLVHHSSVLTYSCILLVCNLFIVWYPFVDSLVC